MVVPQAQRWPAIVCQLLFAAHIKRMDSSHLYQQIAEAIRQDIFPAP
jgi:hypothetical protein